MLSLCEHDCSKETVICHDNEIERFVQAQVRGKGLDERTEKAYRLDLEHLYRWLEIQGKKTPDEKDIERYLEYLLSEKGLKHSYEKIQGLLLLHGISYETGTGKKPMPDYLPC